jgi:hypothetical protein
VLEDRWQKTDDRRQMAEDRRQMAEDRWQETDGRRQMTEDLGIEALQFGIKPFLKFLNSQFLNNYVFQSEIYIPKSEIERP